MPTPNTQVCIFNQTSNLIDITQGAVIFSGVAAAGAPVVLNSQGVIDPTLLQNAVTSVAAENLIPGNLVNLYSNAGVLTAQLAFAASVGTAPSGGAYPQAASGFVNDTVAIGGPVSVIFSGVLNYVDVSSEFTSGNVGAEVYLSTTNKGGITPVRPTGGSQLVQEVGYVLAYNSTVSPAIVTISFITGFQDFSRISGIAQVSQGGTGSATAAGAIVNLFTPFPAINTAFMAALSGSPASPTFRFIQPPDLTHAVFVASGPSHTVGVVPDPGSSAGTTRYLREDSSWQTVPATPAAGSTTQIQYNNAGAFAGSPNLTWTNGSTALNVSGNTTLDSTVTGGVALVVKGDFGSDIMQIFTDTATKCFNTTTNGQTQMQGRSGTTLILNIPLDTTSPCLAIAGALEDGNASVGTTGQALTSTGVGVAWVDQSQFLITTQTGSSYTTAVNDCIVLMNSATAQTLTLTTTSGAGIAAGKTVRVKTLNTGSCTVSGETGNIDGSSSFVISTQYAAFDFVWDGTNWWVF